MTELKINLEDPKSVETGLKVLKAVGEPSDDFRLDREALRPPEAAGPLNIDEAIGEFPPGLTGCLSPLPSGAPVALQDMPSSPGETTPNPPSPDAIAIENAGSLSSPGATDASGEAHDPAKHSVPAKITKGTGLWKKRRGYKKDPVGSTSGVENIPAGPPDPVVTNLVPTFDDLINLISAGISGSTLKPEEIAEICKTVGVENIPALNDNPDAIAKAVDLIKFRVAEVR